jgi:hypothetical protein
MPSFGFFPRSASLTDGFDARTLRQLMQIVTERRDTIDEAWNEFFGEAG